MYPTDLVRLRPLMERTEGSSHITIGVIDGPASLDHPAFLGQRIRSIASGLPVACRSRSSVACTHGTLVTGMLAAKRGSVAPAICPGCTLLLRPIFDERSMGGDLMPISTPRVLAAAIADSISAGANVINLSAAITQPLSQVDHLLEGALNHAAHRGVIVVAAAGNQGAVGSTSITRHPWVIPVISCDSWGNPTGESNLGASIGRRGLAAPGENITSIGSDGESVVFHGTSAAAPFVTGAIALLWSEFPGANAAQIRSAVTRAGGCKRKTVTPPLLNAWDAYISMSVN